MVLIAAGALQTVVNPRDGFVPILVAGVGLLLNTTGAVDADLWPAFWAGLLVVAGVGHMVQMEQASEVNRLLISHITETENALARPGPRRSNADKTSLPTQQRRGRVGLRAEMTLHWGSYPRSFLDNL